MRKQPTSFLRQLLMSEVVRAKNGPEVSLGSPALEAKARTTFALERSISADSSPEEFLIEIKTAFDEIGFLIEFKQYCEQEEIAVL